MSEQQPKPQGIDEAYRTVAALQEHHRLALMHLKKMQEYWIQEHARCRALEQLARELWDMVGHATTWPVGYLDKVDEMQQRIEKEVPGTK